MFHVQKFEISPQDRFFSTGMTRGNNKINKFDITKLAKLRRSVIYVYTLESALTSQCLTLLN